MEINATNKADMDEEIDTPYSAVGFYVQYDKVMAMVRRFDTVALVGRSLEYLHGPTRGPLDYLQRHPWLIFLLIKWTLSDRRAFKHGRPSPNNAEMGELLQLMYDFGQKDAARMPSQFEHIRLFLRAIAYQQFIFQQPIRFTTLARQYFYFGALTEDDYIGKTFKKLVGIDIQKFLGLAQAVLIRFYDGKEKRLSAEWFSGLGQAYNKEEIAAFLSALSKSQSEIRAELLRREKQNLALGRPVRSPVEYWEQTPFINFPLIKTGRSYICVDHHVLFRCDENLIYNTLRSYNAKLFMAYFGPLFESYVDRAIVSTNLPFVREVDIKSIYGQESSAVDFILVDDERNIFVDAKGVEMSYQGKSTHESEELLKWLETSALKAIKQAHQVIKRLPELSADSSLMQRRKTNYLIVVTYSELHVGSGRILADAVGADKLVNLMRPIPEECQIPLKNMFFMTVKEFELLAEAVRMKQIGFAEALDKAAVAGDDPYTEKFEFWQHLHAANINLKEPEYLISEAMKSIDELAAYLKS